MENETVKCNKCGKDATLVNSKEDGSEAWVCHDCKHFISWKPEIYSRVVGYLRPTRQWNKGKQEEFKDRKVFKMPEEMK
jgi:anaerobic ribonucleoside-triphosphate reductase